MDSSIVHLFYLILAKMASATEKLLAKINLLDNFLAIDFYGAGSIDFN